MTSWGRFHYKIIEEQAVTEKTATPATREDQKRKRTVLEETSYTKADALYARKSRTGNSQRLPRRGGRDMIQKRGESMLAKLVVAFMRGVRST